MVVTSGLQDLGDVEPNEHAGLVMLYDDTAYRVATGLLAVIDAYPSRDAFAGRETLARG